MPLRIGKLDTRMRGFSPVVVLQNISIESNEAAATRPAIQLKEVRIGIDLLELLWTGDFLHASWVTLVGARIDVIRYQDGHIAIRGLQSGNDEQPLWLLQGDKYEILQSDISWQDLKNNGKRVSFSNVELVLKNHAQSHEVHLLTTLPEEYGDTLRVSALIQGNDLDANNLDGRIYVEATNLQAPALTDSLLPLDLKIASGSGDLRLWSDWQHSRPLRLAGYMQAQQIKISNPSGKNLQLDTLSGNFAWLQGQERWRLGVYDLDVVANRQAWKDTEFYLQQNQPGNIAALIRHLDLPILARMAPVFVAADSEYQEWLQLNPKGQLNDVAMFLHADREHYAVHGHFNGLGNDSLKSIPGIKGVTGYITGTANSGSIEFDSQDVVVDAPELFRNTLGITRIGGRVSWLQHEQSWVFSGRELVLNSADFETKTDVDFVLPKNQSGGHLDLNTQFRNFDDLSHIPAYLPAKVMGKEALNWLDNAFIGGQVKQGEMIISGNLDEFPFANGNGRFDLLLGMENTEINFNPDWPHIKGINAELRLLGEDLQLAINSGSSETVEIKQALVTLYSLVHSTQVEINGQLQSKIQNALLYLQKTPLRKHADPLLKVMNFEGSSQIDLDLKIPYRLADPLAVKIAAHLDNAGLLVKSAELKISNINGIINFTEDRVHSNQLSATTLGYPIKAVLSSDEAATYLQINGSSNITQLHKQFAFIEKELADGSFAYQADLVAPNAVNKDTSLSIATNLQGVVIDGLDVLKKTADEQRQLKLDFQFDGKQLLPLQVFYGSEFNAALLIDTEQNRLYSGHILFGKDAAGTLQQAGLSVEIRQPVFKASQALNVKTGGDSRWPALREFILDTGQLLWQDQNLGAMRCHFQHENQVWQGNIDNVMAKGRVSIPDEYAGNQPIKLEMEFLNLTAMSSVNISAAEEEAVTILPLIDIDSEQLRWRNVNLGSLKLQTERLNNGTHFKKIKISGKDRQVDFTADWIKQVHGTSTLLNGTMSIDGFGLLLADLGYSDDFKETHADVSFTGGWNDAPQQFSLEKLNGQLHVKLSDGRISSIEPGFGRLLGLISMEQWAKRLSLDFSDMYRQGLAFDRITGNFKITNGVVYSDDLLIDAVAAKMKLAGSANLVDKTVNQRVAVIPKSSDALPIAGTIVGGIATMITSAVTDDYKEGYFFGSEYKISGHWGQLEVIPVKEHDGLVNKTWKGLTDFGWLKY